MICRYMDDKGHGDLFFNNNELVLATDENNKEIGTITGYNHIKICGTLYKVELNKTRDRVYMFSWNERKKEYDTGFPFSFTLTNKWGE